MSNWQNLVKYFNSKVSGKVFTRAEVAAHFCNLSNQNLDTLQTYRNTLRRAGYLKTIEPGVYRKIKKIPNISEHEMKKHIREHG